MERTSTVQLILLESEGLKVSRGPDDDVPGYANDLIVAFLHLIESRDRAGEQGGGTPCGRAERRRR